MLFNVALRPQTIRTVRNREPMTATSTFTQFFSSEPNLHQKKKKKKKFRVERAREEKDQRRRKKIAEGRRERKREERGKKAAGPCDFNVLSAMEE